jgi:hypothetical protein
MFNPRVYFVYVLKDCRSLLRSMKQAVQRAQRSSAFRHQMTFWKTLQPFSNPYLLPYCLRAMDAP